MVNTLPGPSQSQHRRVPPATFFVATLLAVYWGALFYGTHIRLPSGLMPEHLDKLIHFLSYMGLGILFLSLRATRGVFPWSSVIARWFVLAAYGAFDELSQMVVGRNCDPADWLADITGVAIGLAIVTFFIGQRR